MNIGNRLKLLRTSNKLTQKQLAKIIGISSTAISNYELGERIPDALVVKKFAEYFNVSADYILGVEIGSETNNTLLLKSVNNAIVELNNLKDLIVK